MKRVIRHQAAGFLLDYTYDREPTESEVAEAMAWANANYGEGWVIVADLPADAFQAPIDRPSIIRCSGQGTVG
jgi:hypothetical protein